jgi:gluconokinase
MILILMGVSGSGKTTVGKQLAKNLGWNFYEGDDFHPASNIEKMRHGIPLTDEDRTPWLDALQTLIRRLAQEGESAVISCSALKKSYRDRLQVEPGVPRFVFLQASYELIKERVKGRVHPFMKPDLLKSQFEILEEPKDALIVDASQTPAEIIRRIKMSLS